MTDNETIKELQCAAEWFKEHGRNTNTAIIGICDRAVDLINKQKAENTDYVKKDMIAMAIKPCTVWRHDSPWNRNSLANDYSVPLATTEAKLKEGKG